MANYGRIHNIYSIYIDDIDTQDDDDTTMFSISDRLEAIQFNPEHNYWLCVENYAADLLRSANATGIDDNSNGILNICSSSIHQEGSYENINSTGHQIIYSDVPVKADTNWTDSNAGLNKRWVKITNPSSFFQEKKINLYMRQSNLAVLDTITDLTVILAIIETCN